MSQQLPPDFYPFDAEPSPAPSPRKRLKPGIKTFLWTVALLAALVVILYAGVFRVSSIAVVGNQKISWDEVVRSAGLQDGVSYFSVNEGKIRAGIEHNRYLVFEKLEKHFPSSLILYVRERSACANVQVMGITYLMDGEGMVLERAGGALEDSMPVVTGLQTREIRVGSILVPSSQTQLDLYAELIHELQLQGFLTDISELNLSNPESIYLITRDGYTAHLGNGEELRAKIGTVRGVIAKLKEMGKTGGMIEASVPAVATYTPAEM